MAYLSPVKPRMRQRRFVSVVKWQLTLKVKMLFLRQNVLFLLDKREINSCMFYALWRMLKMSWVLNMLSGKLTWDLRVFASNDVWLACFFLTLSSSMLCFGWFLGIFLFLLMHFNSVSLEVSGYFLFPSLLMLFFSLISIFVPSSTSEAFSPPCFFGSLSCFGSSSTFFSLKNSPGSILDFYARSLNICFTWFVLNHNLYISATYFAIFCHLRHSWWSLLMYGSPEPLGYLFLNWPVFSLVEIHFRSCVSIKSMFIYCGASESRMKWNFPYLPERHLWPCRPLCCHSNMAWKMVSCVCI